MTSDPGPEEISPEAARLGLLDLRQRLGRLWILAAFVPLAYGMVGLGIKQLVFEPNFQRGWIDASAEGQLLGLGLLGALLLLLFFPAVLAWRSYMLAKLQTLPPTKSEFEEAVNIMTRAAFTLMLMANLAGLASLFFFILVGDVRCLILGVIGALVLHLQVYPALDWLPERLIRER